MNPHASGGVLITRDISQECQLELAAVGATFALRLISVLVYVDIELSAWLMIAPLMVVPKDADLLRLP
jgi:hypothetical protein